MFSSTKLFNRVSRCFQTLKITTFIELIYMVRVFTFISIQS